MRTDPVTLQVLRNHARAAAESMATTLYRTAHSTFVKETEDFTIQLLDARRQALRRADRSRRHLVPGARLRGGDGLVPGGYRPGDIAITNDPYSGYLATHSPDIVMWKPVFHEGRDHRLRRRAHPQRRCRRRRAGQPLAHADRRAPGGHPRCPLRKLYREGVLDEGLLRVMLANVRMPGAELGRPQGAGRRGQHRRAAHPGSGSPLRARRSVVDGLADLLDYAEAQARAVLARPAGRRIPLHRVLRRGRGRRRPAAALPRAAHRGDARGARLHRHRSADARLAERADRRAIRATR